MSDKIRLFVYGTLKRGCNNHWLLQELDADFIGRAWVNDYTILIKALPYMVPKQGCITHGEIYEIDKNKLQVIDEFEGHPNLYQRKKVTAHLQNNKLIKAYAYIATYLQTDTCKYKVYKCR